MDHKRLILPLFQIAVKNWYLAVMTISYYICVVIVSIFLLRHDTRYKPKNKFLQYVLLCATSCDCILSKY